MELDDAEENRRRRTYVVHRMRRGEMESAETRYGYLANQVKGWDNEFERLQEFTGMDQKFEPGAQGIVDEITERFKEKERANTSLLRWLGQGGGSSTSAVGSASQPALGPPSKDLGTMIYLLGTQSSSINARSMGR